MDLFRSFSLKQDVHGTPFALVRIKACSNLRRPVHVAIGCTRCRRTDLVLFFKKENKKKIRNGINFVTIENNSCPKESFFYLQAFHLKNGDCSEIRKATRFVSLRQVSSLSLPSIDVFLRDSPSSLHRFNYSDMVSHFRSFARKHRTV